MESAQSAIVMFGQLRSFESATNAHSAIIKTSALYVVARYVSGSVLSNTPRLKSVDRAFQTHSTVSSAPGLKRIAMVAQRL